MTPAEIIVILCALSPCYVVNDALHIPIPEVSRYTWPEFYPRGEVGGVCVWFVPMPRGA